MSTYTEGYDRPRQLPQPARPIGQGPGRGTNKKAPVRFGDRGGRPPGGNRGGNQGGPHGGGVNMGGGITGAVNAFGTNNNPWNSPLGQDGERLSMLNMDDSGNASILKHYFDLSNGGLLNNPGGGQPGQDGGFEAPPGTGTIAGYEGPGDIFSNQMMQRNFNREMALRSQSQAGLEKQFQGNGTSFSSGNFAAMLPEATARYADHTKKAQAGLLSDYTANVEGNLQDQQLNANQFIDYALLGLRGQDSANYRNFGEQFARIPELQNLLRYIA